MSSTPVAVSPPSITSASSTISSRWAIRGAIAAKGSDWGFRSLAAWLGNWAGTSWLTATRAGGAASPCFSQAPSSPRPLLPRQPIESGLSSPAKKTKGTILLVEDDDLSARALTEILRRLGWSVWLARTVRDARHQLQRSFDAVILDLMLPDGDGVAVLRQIRRHNLSTIVAVTTGLTDPDRLQQINSLSQNLVLQKPINLAALLQRLNRLSSEP